MNTNTLPPGVDLNTLLKGIQRFLDSGHIEAAQLFITQNKLPYEIVDGKLISTTDQTEPWLKKFVTVNKAMLEVKNLVRKLASKPHEVLISGPTGTGKELLAHALHGNREGRFIPCNCAAIVDTLIESELFGHMKGSFTGADRDKVGLCVAAKDGTLFLDEVGELPLIAQAKLLRVLAEKEITPVGSNVSRDITCRFIFATNRDLKHEALNGRFRIDLLARISTFELHTLGLTDRPEDIVPIIKSLGGTEEMGRSITDLTYNVRSLEQLVIRKQVLG